MDAWRFCDARETMSVAESLGPRLAAALSMVETPPPDEVAPVLKLQRRYELAVTTKALRRLRVDARRLPAAPGEPDPNTTMEHAIAIG